MKSIMRTLKVLCLALLALAIIACASQAESGWVCRTCGQAGNSGNFCPNCGARRPDAGPASTSGAKSARLLMRLSTRSGPGTFYDEPGTFFSGSWQRQTVQVLGKSWDSDNEIWWVLVDFSSGSERYRVWTGLKRVDVNAATLPELYSLGQGTVSATDTWRGPGRNYAKGSRIASWKDVVCYGLENGFAEVEYYDEDHDRVCRCWVPESAASIDWNWEIDVF